MIKYKEEEINVGEEGKIDLNKGVQIWRDKGIIVG